MKARAVSTRRLFFLQAGAALSVPAAVSAARAPQGDVGGGDALKAQLAELEDMNAIRDLHQNYAKLVNTGALDQIARLFAEPSRVIVDEGIRGLSAYGFGERDVIEVSADRLTAAARIHCTVFAETPIEAGCTLVDMARQQGEGVLKRSVTCVMRTVCVKQAGVWRIRTLSLLPETADS